MAAVLLWIMWMNLTQGCSGGGDGGPPGADSGGVTDATQSDTGSTADGSPDGSGPGGDASLDASDASDGAADGTVPADALSDTTPPVWPPGSGLGASPGGPTSLVLKWTAATDDVAVTSYKLYEGAALVATLPSSSLSSTVTGLTTGATYTFKVEAGDAAGNWSTNGPTTTASVVVPDPTLVAPPLDRTVATQLCAAVSFIYSGSDPLQAGVGAGTIDCKRISLIRGRAIDTSGAALSGVQISIAQHPELGTTVTRADGFYDIAVNGGGVLTVVYRKTGFPTLQRQIPTTWQDYAVARDAVMTAYDVAVSAVDMTSASTIQTARGTRVTDPDGARQATVLFAPGTQATMKLPNGTLQALPTIHVRATEYTVGATGLAAMPAGLPPTTAYTYAVELSADEAVQADAVSVQFSQPAFVYVENFLRFPVGMTVPNGFYDRASSRWVPEANGRVVKILSITAGAAVVDVDGSGSPASPGALAAMGITPAELQELAALYAAGQSLWRSPVTHFSPHDSNSPFNLPNGSAPPNQPTPHKDLPKDGCQSAGSVIGCESQSLGESLPVEGTAFRLHYQSDVAALSLTRNTLVIPLSGPTVPAPLKRIDLQITIAGRTLSETYPASPNQTRTFVWDGKDVYGRSPNGAQQVRVNIGYVYPGIYGSPDGTSPNPVFGQPPPSGVPSSDNASRLEITLWQNVSTYLNGLDADVHSVGGWSLSAHHAYDPTGAIYYGTGQKRIASKITQLAYTTAAGGGSGGDGTPAATARVASPQGVAVAPDGSYYIADSGDQLVRKVSAGGVISTFAGGGSQSADGVPATSVQLSNPYAISVAPDGSVYFSEGPSNNMRIRRVDTNGIITTPLPNLGNVSVVVAAAPDGSVYFWGKADPLQAYARVARLATDGTVSTIISQGAARDGEGLQAAKAHVWGVGGLAVAGDGAVYVGDLQQPAAILRIGPDGIVRTIAGNVPTSDPVLQDGILASTAATPNVFALSVGGDGSLLYYDLGRARRISTQGIVDTIVGATRGGTVALTGAARQASLTGGYGGVQELPDGHVLVADGLNNRVLSVGSVVPFASSSDQIVPEADGTIAYVFDSAGRHLRTIDARTNAVLYQFGYDGSGRLATVTDVDGNATTINRGAGGVPTSIVGPYGHTTNLGVTSDGYIASVTNPANEAVALAYKPGTALLASMTNAEGVVHKYDYEASGRIQKDTEGTGESQTVAKTDLVGGVSTTITTNLGRTSTYATELLPDGTRRQTNTLANGLKSQSLQGSDDTTTSTSPLGIQTQLTMGPDPRFGMSAPTLVTATTKLPSGLTGTLTSRTSVTLANPADPFSLQTTSTSTSFNGRALTTDFDTAGRTLTVISPQGRNRTYTYDAKGRTIRQDIPGVESVAVTYDARGNILTATQGTRTVAFTYDASGNVATVTDPMGHVVTYQSDAVGRNLKKAFADGTTIAFDYDKVGNLRHVIPPGRPAHELTYYAAARLQDYIAPAVAGGGTNTRHYALDQDGDVQSYTRPDGTQIVPAYDGAGRMTSIAVPGGGVSFTYDATNGQFATISTPDGTKVAYTYDGSHVTDLVWTGPVAGSVHRTFGADFRAATEAVNGGAPIAFQYDGDGLVVQAGSETITRDPQQGTAASTALGGVTDSFTTSTLGELAGYSASFNATSIYSVAYVRDPLARVQQKNETVGAASHVYVYAYDVLGNLHQVQKDGVTTATYTFDANGNRTQVVTPSGTIAATYDAQDRLLTYGAASYGYTANGELLTKTDAAGTTTYTYDALANLRRVTLGNGTAIDYVIDGNGRRIGRKVGGTLVQGFLYRGSLKPVAELDGAGVLVSRFVYGVRGHVPDYMVKNGTTYRMIADQLGSVHLVVDVATGQVAQQLDYDEFGSVLADTSPGFQPFGFAGGIYDDATKLVHFGVRDYDPSTGRWTTKDASGFAGSDDANLYRYTFGDPLNYIDPDGHYALVLIWVGGVLLTAFLATATIASAIKAIDAVRAAIERGEAAKRQAAIDGSFDVNEEISDPDDLADPRSPYSRSTAGPISSVADYGNCPPNWRSGKKKYWRWRRDNPQPGDNFTKPQLDNMEKGKAPYDSLHNVWLELHHIIAQRDGGDNCPENLLEVWPWEHDDIDPFRHYNGPRP